MKKTEQQSESEKELSAKKEMLNSYIEKNFSTVGDTEQVEFLSTIELQFEMQEFEQFTLSEINSMLKELRYKTEFIEGKPCWKMYRLTCFE